jgi:hypothetical protein
MVEPSDPLTYVYVRIRAPTRYGAYSATLKATLRNALSNMSQILGIASYSFVHTESCLSLCTDIGTATKTRPYEGLYAGINTPTYPPHYLALEISHQFINIGT